MPPVSKSNPVKSQTNLFSFFKKSDTSSASPAAAATPVNSEATTKKSNKSETPKLNVTPKSEAKTSSAKEQIPTPAPTSPVLPPVTPKSSTSPKVKEDELFDSDDEFPSATKRRKLQKGAQVVKEPSSNTKKPSSVSKKKQLDSDEDDEWMESDEDSKDDAVSEASYDEDDEDVVDDEDSFIVDDDESVDRKKKTNKRKASTTTPKAKKDDKKDKKGAVSTPSYKLIPEPGNNSSATPRTPATLHATTPKSAKSTTSLGSFMSSAPADGNDDPAPSASTSFTFPEGVVGQGSHEHNQYDFLKPEHIRDINGNRPDHPEYNPRTLKVPAKYLADQTPAMQQWWQFKCINMDTVLFFKVGKFYELFHMDADIGFSELDLIYMKGHKAHSGFPEVSYGKFASALVTKGYRVARVEQTETPDMLKERNDSLGKGKKDKVVMRELCSIMTKGTRTYCHLDDLSLLDNAAMGISSSLLLCIKELEVMNEEQRGQCLLEESETDKSTQRTSQGMIQATEYGLCCIDTVIGTITLAQFQDDFQRTRLRAFLARYVPTEVLVEYQHVSPTTVGIVKLLAPQATIEYLRGQEFPSQGMDVVQQLNKGQYFGAMKKAAASSTLPIEEMVAQWPKLLQVVAYGLQDASSEAVMLALGGALWQLKRSLIDYEVLSLQQMFAYIPPDEEDTLPPITSSSTTVSTSVVAMEVDNVKTISGEEGLQASPNPLLQLLHTHDADQETLITASAATTTPSSFSSVGSKDDQEGPSLTHKKHLILDEVALSNLEIFVNNYDRTESGSLWRFLNHCQTLGGKRILRQWLSTPLFDRHEISVRQVAIEELLSQHMASVVESSKKPFSGLPDVERLLLRIHSNGIKHISRATSASSSSSAKAKSSGSGNGNGEVQIDHPNTRAILFEANTYTARKIKDFVDILRAYETMVAYITSLQKNSSTATFSSPLLQQLLCPPPVGQFPLTELTTLLAYFRSIFNEAQAKKDGHIKPHPGINADYDTNMALLTELQSDMQDYLASMRRETGIKELVYFGSGKDRYQLEVPVGLLNKVPSNWYSKSTKKTHRRYWTKEIEQKLAQIVATEEAVAMAQKDTLRSLFAKFDETYPLWARANQCISYVDALFSLVHVSALPQYVWPEFQRKEGATGPLLHITNGRHPMLEYALLQRGDGQYIPNDVHLGGTTASTSAGTTSSTAVVPEYCPKMLLLTGPNMGGKSTLLRQTCLIVILAQLGCRVPADRCVLTPVDRIFTRVGASDRILAGQSTFFVELAETSLILKAATEDSLCILDELGRGTATFDGTAIAHAVVNHLVSFMGCRTLFATHYHLLIEDWELDPRIQLGHMDCLVQAVPLAVPSSTTTSTTAEGGEDRVEEVTFLYKLCHGSSPKSYGLNVAKLAGMPLEVIQMALHQSLALEQASKEVAKKSSYLSEGIEGEQSDAWHVKVMQILSVYERINSIVHAPVLNKSPAKLQEWMYLVQEIWKRYDVMRLQKVA